MASRRQTTLRRVSAVRRRCSACSDAIDVADATSLARLVLSKASVFGIKPNRPLNGGALVNDAPLHDLSLLHATQHGSRH